MKKHSSNRSGILLMEIIIAILFFSVVSAVCLQLFVKSHNLSKDSESLAYAVNEATSIAECIRSGQSNLDILKESYSDLIEEDGNYFIYYDNDFNSIRQKKEAFYYLEITPAKIDDATKSYNIAIFKADTKSGIYDLTVTVYNQAKS